MLKAIDVNCETVEMMIFFWESVVAREKVADSYMIELVNRKEMTPLYGEDFSEDSVRKVLSAMVNRELLNGATKKESRFWSNNMWMTEDLDFMREMVAPVKTVNFDFLKEEFAGETKFEQIEVRFIPGHIESFYEKDNVLTVNFFSLRSDFSGGFNIEDKPFKEAVAEKIRILSS